MPDDKTTTTAASSFPSCQVVFVLGGPGSGKGTQCQLWVDRNGEAWATLSAGDLLRAAKNDPNSGELGDVIRSKMAQGLLVPSEVTCKLIERGMRGIHAERPGVTKFLVDGFPRSAGNVSAWEDTMADRHAVKMVLNLSCPEEVMTGRLLERGKEAGGREDDANLDIIRKRFRTHQTETAPVLEAYEAQGIVRTVPSDRPIENVYEQVAALLNTI